MEIRKTPLTLGAAAVAAVLIFVGAVYLVGHIAGWFEGAASTDANAQESNLRIVEPTYATSVTLNDIAQDQVWCASHDGHETLLTA